MRQQTFLLTDDPVDWIVVVKRDKGKAPLLPRSTISHDVNDLDLAKLREVIAQVTLLRIFLDASNKDFLYRYMSTWSVWILWWKTVDAWMRPSTFTCKTCTRVHCAEKRTSLDTARLGSTTRPSTLCGRSFMASSTSCTDEYVTNPKPLDRLVLGSLMTWWRS